jgi:hypothetical protein
MFLIKLMAFGRLVRRNTWALRGWLHWLLEEKDS